MPIERKICLTCENCKEEEEINYMSAWERGVLEKGVHKTEEGWLSFGDSTALCPECAKLFEQEMKRHEEVLHKLLGRKEALAEVEDGRRYRHE